jgi:hypothetical protein
MVKKKDDRPRDKNGRFTKVNKSNASHVSGFIDESNTGGVTQGKHYVLGATVVDADKEIDFGKITEKRRKDKELKFIRNKSIRDEVLIEISKLNPRLYAVTIKKGKWKGEEYVNVHRNGLVELIDSIAKKERAKNIRITTDYTEYANDEIVKLLTAESGKKHKKNIIGEAIDSKKSPQIQTNDFVVGAMNKAYNRNEKRYVKKLGTRVHKSHITKRVTKPKRKGE